VSKKPAAIPLFADAYLADTTHLTTEEHGAYLLLLMASWRQADCALPNDDRKLARITGLSPRKWAAIKSTIMEFWTVEGDRIHQLRLRREHEFVCKKSEANRKSAEARWGTQDDENKGNGGMRSHCDGNAPPPPPVEREKEPNGSSLSAPDQSADVFDAWDRMVAISGNPRCNKRSAKRRTACRARLREDGLAAILLAISRIPQSSFLRGETGSWAGADIDFLLRPDTVTKILEGKYDDRPKQPGPSGSRSFDGRDGVAKALDGRLGLGDPAGSIGRRDAGESGSYLALPAPRLAAVR
jgi:uncharacterized protein YdaU (DUF1376 family)